MEEITLDYLENLASNLPVEEQKRLVERLETRLTATPAATSAGKQLRSLRGLWQGKFPADLDVEAEIRAIRDEWKQELEEFGS